jgi:glycosyltransferase
MLKYGWMPAHPTFFVRREVYERCGDFNTSFRIAADYDLMLRVLSKGIRTHYIPSVLYRMRQGGASNKNLRNILRKMREDYHALRINDVGGMRALAAKNLSKISQFLRRRIV